MTGNKPLLLCFEPQTERHASLHARLGGKFEVRFLSKPERALADFAEHVGHVSVVLVSALEGALWASRVAQAAARASVRCVAMCPTPSSARAFEQAQVWRTVIGPFNVDAVQVALDDVGTQTATTSSPRAAAQLSGR